MQSSSSFMSSSTTARSSLLPQHHPSSSIPPPITARQARQHSKSPAPRLSGSILRRPGPASGPTLSALHARASQLQLHLQTLLDAQAAALVPGGFGPEDASDGSYTPTTADSSGLGSAQRRRTTNVKTQPLSLRAARRGILDAIRELAVVKAEEGKVLQGSVRGVDEVRAQLEGWAGKKAGLEKEIERIEKGRLQESLKELRREDETVSQEIKELETRLVELKNRQRHVRRRIVESENDVEAKASTYKASREIVDGQIKVFLAKPPELEGDELSNDGFMKLPKGRRTLEMAKSHFDDVEKTLREQKNSVDIEQEALEEGAIVWKEVVQEINRFEKKLKVEMQQNYDRSKIMSTNKTTLSDNYGPHETPKNNLLAEMDAVLDDIEAKLEMSEDRNWNLLVCCVGAELEAFREGREVLRDVLGIPEQAQVEDDQLPKDSSWQDPLGVEPSFNSDGERIPQDTDKTGHEHGTTYDRTESEDEDPGPDLLISRIESG